MTNTPIVSVVMPAYNSEMYIARAIESILDQTLKDFELIIIDDASTDKTYKIAMKYKKADPRVRLIKNRNNLKIAATLNKGIKLANADLVARMDADDISLKNRLELQRKYLIKNKNVAVVGGYMEIIDEVGNKIAVRKYPIRSKDLKATIFRYSPFAHPTVMYRKSVINEFRGYALNLYPCEDLDLWLRIGTKYDFGCINKPLLKYTLYTDSSSHKRLRNVEMTTFKIRLRAFKDLGYRPSLYDIAYNIGQFSTIWVLPSALRVKLYNLLRNNDII